MTPANKVNWSSCQSPKGTHKQDKGLSKETKTAVLDFYEKFDVTWQTPGKRDRIIRRVSGEKGAHTKELLALYFERSTFCLFADKTTINNRILNILQVAICILQVVSVCQVFKNFCLLSGS